VVKTGQRQVISLADEAGLPRGLAQQTICQAMVLPVTSRGEEGAVGVLVAGVSPARKLDAEYRTFYELIAGQIATAIQNARAAEEERNCLESLAELDRAKTTFFSNVSHEFRTPLTLMLGPVEDLLAKSYTGLSPAAKSQLELVNRNGLRLLRLVNTLLDFSRIEADRMQAIYLPTDLAAFTVELASVFRSATEKAGLQLEDCPKLDEPVFVDRGMWEKIVLNLISNAFKFTFEGSIAVWLTKSGSDVELRVRDTGVGIPSKELSRLFDRFHRIESTRSRTHEGSGIGLALVQELVQLHGGSVRVESNSSRQHFHCEPASRKRSSAATELRNRLWPPLPCAQSSRQRCAGFPTPAKAMASRKSFPLTNCCPSVPASYRRQSRRRQPSPHRRRR
jgi:signal transduction histidine kinase